MLDVIVLGATFAAAGIAQKYKDTCLVLEHGTRAGYEFFGALNFGKGWETAPFREEATQLQGQLLSGFYGGDRHIYPYFQESNILFQADVVSVEQVEDHFVCVTHGIDGFSSFEAKTVIDTRCRDGMCISKTYNLLVESSEIPVISGATAEKAPGENRYLLRCAVPADCSYPEARQVALGIMGKFTDGQKVILSADVFDYQVKAGYPKAENGIFCLPSKAYGNPVLAFQAGLEVAV